MGCRGGRKGRTWGVFWADKIPHRRCVHRRCVPAPSSGGAAPSPGSAAALGAPRWEGAAPALSGPPAPKTQGKEGREGPDPYAPPAMQSALKQSKLSVFLSAKSKDNDSKTTQANKKCANLLQFKIPSCRARMPAFFLFNGSF